jgi:hypothetical protein
MRKSTMVKIGAFGTVLGGLRHQGRHRRSPWSRDGTRLGWTRMIRGERQTATLDHQDTDTAIQDFYVVFPNVPALPGNLSS